jgi:hypothetical protein
MLILVFLLAETARLLPGRLTPAGIAPSGEQA